MEIKAKLKQVLPVVEKGEFKSRKIWVTTEDNPQYPQTIELEVSGKSLDIFNNVSPGADVTCHINLRGREWTPADGGATRVFNTLACWRVEAAGTQQPAPKVPASQEGFPVVELPEVGGLPF